MTIKAQLLSFLFFAFGILAIMGVAIGWSFVAFGLLSNTIAWFVNFLGWAGIGFGGQQLLVYLARRFDL